MQPAPIPSDEATRLVAVQDLHILDTPSEQRYDSITATAAAAFSVPICTISIIDSNREWFKSCVGTEKKEGDRSTSFCGHTIMSGKMLIIEDTLLDSRFADNPQVINPPHIRFYAGITLFDQHHFPIGAFCLKDTEPRSLQLPEIQQLMDFAKQAERELSKSSVV